MVDFLIDNCSSLVTEMYSENKDNSYQGSRITVCERKCMKTIFAQYISFCVQFLPNRTTVEIKTNDFIFQTILSITMVDKEQCVR